MAPREVLGGSSAVNFLLHTHANRVDLANWEKLGNPGWNFDILQPHYRKSDTYNASSSDEVTPGADIIDPSLHGQAGPIQTSFPRGVGAVALAWDPTFTNLGLAVEGQDRRAGATVGGYSVLMSMNKNARRCAAAQAYLSPAADRSNLTVLTNVHVNRFLFAPTGPPFVATGVVYTADEEEFFVEAKSEIIVCAGSINSPQILELFWNWFRRYLYGFGVDVLVANRHVGENLQVSVLHLYHIENVSDEVS
jgi:choline dehydrogenase-like flavoprotein